MRISGIIQAIFGLITVLALLSLQQTYANSDTSTIFVIIGIIGLISTYLAADDINYYFLNLNINSFDPQLKSWLDNYYINYSSKSHEEKEELEFQLKRFMQAFSFTLIHNKSEEAYEDIKMWIALSAVHLCKNFDPVLEFKQFERYIVYRHPFPTPKIRELHSVEIEPIDGAILFNLEHLLPSIIQQNKHYNIGLHAFIEAFILNHNEISWPLITDNHLIKWEKHPVPKFGYILKWTGLSHIDPLTVGIHHYAWFGEVFKQIEPTIFNEFNHIFNLYE